MATRRHNLLWAIGILGAVNVVLGLAASSVFLAAGGAAGICFAIVRLKTTWPRTQTPVSPRPKAEVKWTAPVPAVKRYPADPNDPHSLPRQMLAQGRYALLLRKQIAPKLSEEMLQQALEELQERMALVPDGEVALGQIDDALEDGRVDDAEIIACRGRVIQVQHMFLDRYPVTNREFYEFVGDGGYEKVAFWNEAIWPAVLDFVDLTGEPGPAFWRNGCYEQGKDDHPVTGVSWYEAAAYARWAGKRLPTDAEWVKAGAWPVPLSNNSRVQRRFPWGDTMDRERANLWGSGREGTTPVTDYPDGVSVGGVYQLIGNVWEWTSGNYRPGEHLDGEVVLPVPMKNVRGGAFDTYFDNQATCHFYSGENPVLRKDNVGFRCAVGVCDLVLSRNAAAPEEHAEEPATPAPEEVTT